MDMPTDLLNKPLEPADLAVLAVYRQLKDLLAANLPPFAQANLRDALASVSVVVTGAALTYDILIDDGV